MSANAQRYVTDGLDDRDDTAPPDTVVTSVMGATLVPWSAMVRTKSRYPSSLTPPPSPMLVRYSSVTVELGGGPRTR